MPEECLSEINTLKKKNRDLESQVKRIKHAEQALWESEEKLRNFLEFATLGIWCFQPKKPVDIHLPLEEMITRFFDSTCVECNDTYAGMMGVSREEIIGMKLSDAMPDTEENRDYLRAFVKNGFKLSGGISREIIDDGSEKYFSNSMVGVIKNDFLMNAWGTQTDVTEHKRAEEALRESEKNFRDLVENLLDGVAITDDGGVPVYVNPRFSEITGFNTDELLEKKSLDAILSGPDRGTGKKGKKKKTGTLSQKNHEQQIVRKDGVHVPIEISTTLTHWQGKKCLMTIIRDIISRKKAEEEKSRLESQLYHSQKMEAVGTLAGGIAHNFNNILMGIQGFAQLMKMDKSSTHPDWQHLKSIEISVQNAVDLTQQLLGFGSVGKYMNVPIDLNELIRKESEIFVQTKKEIRIQQDYEKNLWAVKADRGQIQQVILNIYVNAWQAMPRGGSIYVRTENVVIDRDYQVAYKVQPGRYVKISVTDTGSGIDGETREKIFDPFFTTKDRGFSSGLGLASVYGIIKNHRGFIDVHSEIGKGTTFYIFLPACREKAVKEKKNEEKLIRGTGTILLVDDESVIRDVGSEILKKLGYRVMVAGGGKEALKIYGEKRDQIHLVILDMIMPEMGGEETFERLVEMDSDVPVLLSSGYSLNGQAEEILKKGCRGFIKKPFTMNELSEKIRNIIECS